MALLAGVTFRKVGKLHYFAADLFALTVGTFVIAETEDGTEYGEVKILREVSGTTDEQVNPFRILRVATTHDREQVELRRAQAADGLRLCQERADGLHLPMRIVESEVAFDGHQITLYFVADARIDFRQLVKETAAKLRMRVHLHQVGSRDHAKALGGYGPCGRPLCCTTFLRDFAPVSMKMAKDQSLYLNPSKFSGVCGKLMCCLRYEHDLYVEAKQRLPGLEATVVLPSGERGKVIEVNVLKETVTVTIRDEETTRINTFPASEVRLARACGDCGAAGGGCGSDACSTNHDENRPGSVKCSAPAKVPAAPIQLERWKRNWTA